MSPLTSIQPQFGIGRTAERQIDLGDALDEEETTTSRIASVVTATPGLRMKRTPVTSDSAAETSCSQKCGTRPAGDQRDRLHEARRDQASSRGTASAPATTISG